jgi:hypothetical protein
MTLVDPVNPDMTATLSDLVEVSGYAPPTLEDGGMATISKAKASNALGTVYVIQLDANGNQLEKWTLWNAFLIDVKFGDMSYGDDALQEVSLELRYDWAQVEVLNKSSLKDGKPAKNNYFKV